MSFLVRNAPTGRGRRRGLIAAILALALTVVGCGSGPAPTAVEPAASKSAASSAPESSVSGTPAPTRAAPSTSASAERQATLPRGGRTVFPRYRLVGYAGLTGAKTLGRLGTGPLDQRVREMERRARPYATGREILPVLEVIASVVQASPGRDGKYRTRISDREISTYLKAARKRKALLLLNIQPGRSTFMAEAKAYQRWLKEPDVGLALDPEWAMHQGQVPGRVFGYTTGAELNEVAEYLATIVAKEKLPEKVMVYHQLAPRIVRGEGRLKAHRGVALVKSIDGIGTHAAKVNTYRLVNKTTPDHVHPGFKLFYTEDARGSSTLMSAKQVLALKPRPDYVLYE